MEKKLIIVICIFICSICKGQTFIKLSDSTALYGTDIISTNEIAKSWHFIDSGNLKSNIQYDTIKVEMLCTSIKESDNKVVKIIGYEVNRRTYYSAMNGYENGNNYYGEHSEYLDIIKQPMNKNIYVWLSHSIK